MLLNIKAEVAYKVELLLLTVQVLDNETIIESQLVLQFKHNFL
jgi:hypothetical protein